MRSSCVCGLLVYRCAHFTKLSADRWPDHIRISDLEPLFVCQACGRSGADYQAGLRLGAEVSKRRRATALIVPNALTAPAFVHAKGSAFARVKHNLNDLGPIAAANAPELFLGLFAAQSMSAEEVHVMLQGHQSGRWSLVPQNWLNSEYFVA
jgi:hypothetical protein